MCLAMSGIRMAFVSTVESSATVTSFREIGWLESVFARLHGLFLHFLAGFRHLILDV